MQAASLSVCYCIKQCNDIVKLCLIKSFFFFLLSFALCGHVVTVFCHTVSPTQTNAGAELKGLVQSEPRAKRRYYSLGQR